MRRLLSPLIATALLSACATPRPAPGPATPRLEPEPIEKGELIGLTAEELGARLGAPDLVVREGAGTKLQWRGACVLDAYLYADRGAPRTTHVDSRSPQGADVDQLGCLAALAAR